MIFSVQVRLSISSMESEMDDFYGSMASGHSNANDWDGKQFLVDSSTSTIELMAPIDALWLAIPTRVAPTVMTTNYLCTGRSTNCDINCTVTTAEYYAVPIIPPQLVTVMGKLPYKKKKKIIGSASKGETYFQKLKLSETKSKNQYLLKAEKEDFFQKLLRDRYEKEMYDNNAVTMVQALFRGYRKRKMMGLIKSTYQRPLKKRPKPLQISELQDELCQYASLLTLKPIPGLSLESRGRASRRRQKIEIAASLRVATCMRMFLAKRKARRRMALIIFERRMLCAITLTRFFRFIKMKNFKKRLFADSSVKAAVIIQCQVRIWLAHLRVRRIRKDKGYHRRAVEATIKIQRRFKPKTKMTDPAKLEEIKMHNSLAKAVINTVINIVMDLEIEEATSIVEDEQVLLRMRLLEEDRRQIEFTRRAMEEEMIRIADEEALLERFRLAAIEEAEAEKERLRLIAIEQQIEHISTAAQLVESEVVDNEYNIIAVEAIGEITTDIQKIEELKLVEAQRLQLQLQQQREDEERERVEAQRLQQQQQREEEERKRVEAQHLQLQQQQREEEERKRVEAQRLHQQQQREEEERKRVEAQHLQLQQQQREEEERKRVEAQRLQQQQHKQQQQQQQQQEHNGQESVAKDVKPGWKMLLKPSTQVEETTIAQDENINFSDMKSARPSWKMMASPTISAMGIKELSMKTSQSLSIAMENIKDRLSPRANEGGLLDDFSVNVVVATMIESAVTTILKLTETNVTEDTISIEDPSVRDAASPSFASLIVQTLTQKAISNVTNKYIPLETATQVITRLTQTAVMEIVDTQFPHLKIQRILEELSHNLVYNSIESAIESLSVASQEGLRGVAENNSVVSAISGWDGMFADDNIVDHTSVVEGEISQEIVAHAIDNAIAVLSRPSSQEGLRGVAENNSVVSAISGWDGMFADDNIVDHTSVVEGEISQEIVAHATDNASAALPRNDVSVSSDYTYKSDFEIENIAPNGAVSSTPQSSLPRDLSEQAKSEEEEVLSKMEVSFNEIIRGNFTKASAELKYSFKVLENVNTDNFGMFLRSGLLLLDAQASILDYRFSEAEELLNRAVEMRDRASIVIDKADIEVAYALKCMKKAEYEQAMKIVAVIIENFEQNQVISSKALTGLCLTLDNYKSLYLCATSLHILAECQRELCQFTACDDSLTKCNIICKSFLIQLNATLFSPSLEEAKFDFIFSFNLKDSINSLMFDAALTKAHILTAEGSIGEAFYKFEETMHQCRSVYGTNHPKVAIIMNELALLSIEKCSFTEAETLVNESLAMKKMYFPADHPIIAESLLVKATSNLKLGYYNEGCESVEEGLRILQLSMGNEHPIVADSLLILADLTRSMGFPVDAHTSYVSAKAIYENMNTANKQSLRLAKLLVGLGVNYLHKGKYFDAINALESALAMNKTYLRIFDITKFMQLEVNIMHLAHAYCHVNRLDDAREILVGCTDKIVSLVGQKHLAVAQSYMVLGVMNKIRGRYVDAKSYLLDAYDLTLALFDEQHPDVQTLRYELSDALQVPGYFKESAEYCNASLYGRIATFGEDSFITAISIYNRAKIVRDLGSLNDAAKLYLQSLDIIKNQLGVDNGIYAEVLGSLCRCYRLLGQYDESKATFDVAIELLRKECGPNHYLVSELMIEEALLSMDKNHPDSSKQLLNQILPHIKSTVGDEHPLYYYAIANIGICMNMIAYHGDNKIKAVEDPEGTKPGFDNIDRALEFFNNIPFGDNHPWVNELGGWGNNESVSGSRCSSRSGKRVNKRLPRKDTKKYNDDDDSNSVMSDDRSFLSHDSYHDGTADSYTNSMSDDRSPGTGRFQGNRGRDRTFQQERDKRSPSCSPRSEYSGYNKDGSMYSEDSYDRK